MKNGLLLTAFLCICSFICAYDLEAQSVNITGTIKNQDGYPISQARISLVIAGIETTSDAIGRFTLINTGFEMMVQDEPLISFYGNRLNLKCNGENVSVSVFDLAGKEVTSILTNCPIAGTYVVYPGAYIDQSLSAAYVVKASVGKDYSAFLFVPQKTVKEQKGLFESESITPSQKSSGSFTSVDTLMITHDDYEARKIPLGNLVTSFGDIIVAKRLPLAPSDLTGNSESPTSITLTWVDNSNNETEYIIERSTNLMVEWSSFAELARVPANTTSYTDETVTQGTTYKYRVQAVNNGGESTYSNTTTISAQASVPISITGPATSTGSFDITVSYSWPGMLVSTDDRYELEESTSPTGNFTKIDDSPWGQRPTSYTFHLTRSSGTYYYRARAKTHGMYTVYTEVISVSIDAPQQTAKLKVVNNTHYAMIDIQLNGQQQVSQGYGVLQGNHYTFEFDHSGNTNYSLGVGFWDGSTRDVWFYLSGNTYVTVGTTATLTFNNPTISHLLSGFSDYRDYTGEYWIGTVMYMAGFRFFNNGTWKFYDNGNLQEAGYLILVQWEDNANVVYFKLCPSCDNIALYYPFGQFYYNNGPASWPTIQYTAQ